MGSFGDIIDGSQAHGRRHGLIYTHKCGWVDLGHAQPENALELYRKVQAANLYIREVQANFPRRVQTPTQWREPRSWFFHRMGGRYRLFGSRWWGGLDVGRHYYLRKHLTPDQVKSVALGIYMNVSIQFESFQEGISRLTGSDSGFSGEDLVSNLIGFYRAVEPWRPYIDLCEPASLLEAYLVWRQYGPVGENQSREFSVNLYPPTYRLDVGRTPQSYPPRPNSAPMTPLPGPIPRGRVTVPLPPFLDTIRPEAPGILYGEGGWDLWPGIEKR